jgi:hypothetical protein
MGDVEKRISAIDTIFSQKFPDYAALASPQPLSARDTQALLRPGEALYHLVLDDDRSLAWVITRDAVRWRPVALGRQALADPAAPIAGLCGRAVYRRATGRRSARRPGFLPRRRLDVAMIRRQQPLPETADEVCAVASAFGPTPDAVFLGPRATEGTLKSLNAKARSNPASHTSLRIALSEGRYPTIDLTE